MGRLLGAFCIAVLLAVLGRLAAQDPGPSFPEDERLRYSIAWPSGLPVGEGELRARRVDLGWRFEMTLRASLPKTEIDDAFVSRTDASMCSEQFEKHVRHGRKRAHESLRFGPGRVERRNLEPQRPEVPGVSTAPPCARDALAFLQFLRRDLAAGRISPPGAVYFGAAYRVELEFVRSRLLTVGEQRRIADEIRAVVRGPASEHGFSVFFGRDDSRTPLLFRVEFEEGSFTMALAE